VQAAEFALRRTRIELATAVRNGYFDVLVAQQRVRYARLLPQLAETVYRAQIELVAGGEAAAYEPLQLRVFALQAGNAVRRAENSYLAAWRQLAANLGLPQLAPAELAGSVDAPVPRVTYDAALNYLLTHHTDLAIAQTQIDKAVINLRLQRVTPIPNVNVLTVYQHDATTPPYNAAFNLQVGVPLPVFNNNRGNIVAAEAQLVSMQQTMTDTRNTLTASLAEVFQRYASNSMIAGSYRTDILSDQVRSSRGIYERFRQAGGDVDFAQVVLALQNLGQVVNDYLGALDDQWQAVVDLAQVLQIDDLFALEATLAGPAASGDAQAETIAAPTPAGAP
jgi:cobalt-zinc-cadmium efflux system outer membrane protein